MPAKGEELEHTSASCTAKTRDGDLCKNPPMVGSTTCRMHGSATKAARAKAQERIAEAADSAAGTLIGFMNSKKVPYNIRLAAAKDLLDRANIGTTKEVQVELRKFENIEGLFIDTEELEERRAARTANQLPILEAEIVEDDEQ